MRLMLLVMMFLIIDIEIYAEDFYLIKNSKISCTFIKPNIDIANWNSNILFFNKNLKECTGCSLPVDSKTVKNKITVKIINDNDLLTDDKFKITFPDLETMQITCSKRSFRWALNFILEEYVGIRFLMPGKYGEYLPQVKTVAIPMEKIEKVPSFKLYRHVYPWMGPWASCLNNKIALSFMHNLPKIAFPVEKYISNNSWPINILPTIDGKKYFPKLSYFRGRKVYNLHWQPCWTHPDSKRIAVENILAYLNENPDTNKLSISINDNGGFCHCKNCIKNGIKINSTGHQNFSEIYYKWCNEVVEEVSKKYPNVYFGLIAYCEVFSPPSFKLHPKIVCFLCIDSYACTDPNVKIKKEKIIKEWHKKCQHIGLWEYGFGGGWNFLPRTYFKLQSDFLKFFNKNGGEGVFVEVDHKNLGESLKQYMYYKLFWDCSLDCNEIINDWCEKCVGAQSASYLKKYYMFWEEFWRDRAPKSAWFQGSKNNVYMAAGFGDFFYALKKGDMKYCREQMENVVKYAQTQRQKERAKILMKDFEYYEANVYSSCAEIIPLTTKAESASQAVEILKAIPAAMKYVAKLPQLSKITNHKNISNQLTSGIISAIVPFIDHNEVQKELMVISENEEISPKIRGEAYILLCITKDKKSLKNLFENHSFEQEGLNWNNTDDVSACSRSKDYSYSGKYSMKWQGSKPWVRLSRYVEIKPNTPYICMGRIFIPKNQSNVESSVQFAAFLRKDAQRTLTWYIPPKIQLVPGKWTPFSVYVPPHKDAHRAYLWITLNNFVKGNKVYIDDLILTEIPINADKKENPNT